MTRAMAEALRERFDRLPGRQETPGVGELRAIAKRVVAYAKLPYLDHANRLHDKHGLPK